MLVVSTEISCKIIANKLAELSTKLIRSEISYHVLKTAFKMFLKQDLSLYKLSFVAGPHREHTCWKKEYSQF